MPTVRGKLVFEFAQVGFEPDGQALKRCDVGVRGGVKLTSSFKAGYGKATNPLTVW